MLCFFGGKEYAFKKVIYFMHMSICIYTMHCMAGACKVQKRISDFPKLELQWIVSWDVGAIGLFTEHSGYIWLILTRFLYWSLATFSYLF